MSENPITDAELPIPVEGLEYVLSAWIGRGQLLNVVNSVASGTLPRDWRFADVKLRADLMLFLELVPLIARLPKVVRQYIDLLPAQSHRFNTISSAPSSGTTWPQTRRTFGWPPSAFVVRQRDRVAHELLSTLLAWVGSHVLRLAEHAAAIDASAINPVSPQLSALSELFEIGFIEPSDDEPRPSDLLAAEREGAVWRKVVDVARLLIASNEPLLAAKLLWPIPELRPTLFQLGVLGELLRSFKSAGAAIVSTSPLSGVTGREQFHVRRLGRTWHLWMEAGGSWNRYGYLSLYRSLASTLRARTRSLSPDLLLLLPGEAALILECKYSADAEYVARSGLSQTLLYMTDAGASMATTVEGIVVAPESTVSTANWVNTPAGRLGLSGPDAVVQRALRFVDSFGDGESVATHIDSARLFEGRALLAPYNVAIDRVPFGESE